MGDSDLISHITFFPLILYIQSETLSAAPAFEQQPINSCENDNHDIRRFFRAAKGDVFLNLYLIVIGKNLSVFTL
jgi:hypothetical protein